MTIQAKPAVNLYHGTSTIFLPGIEEFGLGGQNILDRWGFYEFVRELAPLCENRCEEIDSYIFNKIVRQEVGHSNFQHGQTYLSPSKSTAARYAASNAFGSELISEALTRVELLLKLDCGVDQLLSRFPEVSAVMASKPTPLLITIPNATRYKLRTEHGADPEHKLRKIFATLQDDPSTMDLHHQQDNFRLDAIVSPEELIFESITLTGWNSGFPSFEIGPFKQ